MTKYPTKNAYMRQLCIGVPISLLFMGVVVAAQIGLQYVKWEVGGENTED